jgi:hypothetical protein
LFLLNGFSLESVNLRLSITEFLETQVEMFRLTSRAILDLLVDMFELLDHIGETLRTSTKIIGLSLIVDNLNRFNNMLVLFI